MKGDKLTKRHKSSYLLTNQMTGLRFGIGIGIGSHLWYAYLKKGLGGETLHHGITRRECLEAIERYQVHYVAEVANVLKRQAYQLPFRFDDKYQLLPLYIPFDFVEVDTSPDPEFDALNYKIMIYIYGYGLVVIALKRDMLPHAAWYYDFLDMADRWLVLEKEDKE